LKFIQKKLLKNLASVAGVNLLIDVVGPLEEDSEARKHIKKIKDKYGYYEGEVKKG